MCFQIVVVCYRNNRSKNNYMIQNLRFKDSRFKNSKIHNYWTASLLAMWQSVFIFSTLNSRLIYRASDGEVELAVIVTSGAIHVIESITPVEAKQTKHREEDTHTHACRPFHIKRIKVLEPEPAVTRLKV